MGSANIAKPSQEGGGGQQRTGWGLSRLTQSPESPGASDPGQEGPLRCPSWGLGDSLAENFPRQGGPLLEAWLHCGEAWGYGFHILRCDLPFGDPSCLGLASGCPKSVLLVDRQKCCSSHVTQAALGMLEGWMDDRKNRCMERGMDGWRHGGRDGNVSEKHRGSG